MTSNTGLPTSTTYPTRDENGNLLTTEFGMCVYKNHQVITIQVGSVFPSMSSMLLSAPCLPPWPGPRVCSKVIFITHPSYRPKAGE